jgi:hypothetical protein
VPGLITTTDEQSIVSAIDDILLIAEYMPEEEIRDQAVVFLPFRGQKARIAPAWQASRVLRGGTGATGGGSPGVVASWRILTFAGPGQPMPCSKTGVSPSGRGTAVGEMSQEHNRKWFGLPDRCAKWLAQRSPWRSTPVR